MPDEMNNYSKGQGLQAQDGSLINRQFMQVLVNYCRSFVDRMVGLKPTLKTDGAPAETSTCDVINSFIKV